MRRGLIVMGALGALIALWMGIDALIVSDEERLEQIAEDFHGAVTSERIDAALAHFDPDVETVEVNARGIARVYGRGAAEDLRRDAHRGVRMLLGDNLTALRSSVEVDGDRGSIRLHLMGTSRGMSNVEMHLDRDGERWLVSRFQVTR